MMLGGDEFGRTQRGNNNAYCQDNEISWFDWSLVARNSDLVEFFRKAIAFTRRFPVLQCRKFLLGEDLDDDGVPDLTWFAPDQGEPDWNDPDGADAVLSSSTVREGRRPTESDRLFFILNGHYESQWVQVAAARPRARWYRAIDTSLPAAADFAEAGEEVRLDPGDHYIANPRSTVVLLARTVPAPS